MSDSLQTAGTTAPRISFIGGGNMASALIGGMLERGFAAADIQVVEISESACESLRVRFGVRATCAIDDAFLDCDLLMLAVKPQGMKAALAPLAGRLDGQVVVSIAAGIRATDLVRWLGGHALVVRAMPNTPALIGAGITGLCALPEVSDGERSAADRLLRSVGTTVWIAGEAGMDAVTALSGSGPAYVFLFIEALEQAAAELGFTPEQGRQLAVGTVQGAAALAAQSAEPASLLRERVTSKGGTTEAALGVMNERGVREGIVAGVKAAEARGRELGRLLGAN